MNRTRQYSVRTMVGLTVFLLAILYPAHLWGEEKTVDMMASSPKAKVSAARTNKAGATYRPLFGAGSLSGPPQVELFGAYSRWYPESSINGHPLYPLKNGIVASATYYRDVNVGFELEGSYYQQIPANGQMGAEGKRGAAFGPVYRFIVPWVEPRLHGLVGSDNFFGPVLPNTASGGFYANQPLWTVTLTAGGSVDLEIPKTHGHFAARAQVDYQYIHGSYGPAYSNSGGQINLNTYRIAPGLVYRFHPMKVGR